MKIILIIINILIKVFLATSVEKTQSHLKRKPLKPVLNEELSNILNTLFSKILEKGLNDLSKVNNLLANYIMSLNRSQKGKLGDTFM